jgi:hypothetical protein
LINELELVCDCVNRVFVYFLFKKTKKQKQKELFRKSLIFNPKGLAQVVEALVLRFACFKV